MSFDPKPHIIQLKQRGGGYADYLPVAARLAWFRETHPDGQIIIDPHLISEQVAIFRARVSVPGGGSADGWGSETPQDFKDYIEKGSTKALGRALAAMGFGAMQTGEELDEGERIVDSPVDRTRSAPRPQHPTPAPAAPQRPVQATTAAFTPAAELTAEMRGMPRAEFVAFFEERARSFEEGDEIKDVQARIGKERPRFNAEQYGASLAWWKAFTVGDEAGMAQALNYGDAAMAPVVAGTAG